MRHAFLLATALLLGACKATTDDGGTVSGVTFTLSPATVAAGGIVTIHASTSGGFGTSPTVVVGNVSVTLTMVDASNYTFKVPFSVSGNVPIYLTVSGKSSNIGTVAVTFTKA